VTTAAPSQQRQVVRIHCHYSHHRMLPSTATPMSPRPSCMMHHSDEQQNIRYALHMQHGTDTSNNPAHNLNKHTCQQHGALANLQYAARYCCCPLLPPPQLMWQPCRSNLMPEQQQPSSADDPLTPSHTKRRAHLPTAHIPGPGTCLEDTSCRMALTVLSHIHKNNLGSLAQKG